MSWLDALLSVGGPPGPVGPNSTSVLKASFLQPAVGSTVSGVLVDEAAWQSIGMYTQIGGAGFYTVTGISGNSLTLLLTAAAGITSGNTVPANSVMVASGTQGPAGSILGTAFTGLSRYDNAAADWVVLTPGQTLKVWNWTDSTNTIMSNLVFGETFDASIRAVITCTDPALTVSGATNATPIRMTVNDISKLTSGSYVSVSSVGGNTAANGGWPIANLSGSSFDLVGSTGNGSYTSGGSVLPSDFGGLLHQVLYRSVHGTIVNATGSTSDIDLTTPAPPNNATGVVRNATASFAPVANTSAAFSVTAPGSSSILVGYTIAFNRRPPPGAGTVPTITSTDVSSGPDTGGTVLHLVGSHFTGTTNVTLNGKAAAGFSVVDDSHLTVTSALAPGFDGTGAIVVTNGAGPGNNPSVTWTYTYTLASVPNLIDWFDPAVNVTTGGGTISQHVGRVFGKVLIQATGANQPTYNATDATFNNLPSLYGDMGGAGGTTPKQLAEQSGLSISQPNTWIFVLQLVGDTVRLLSATGALQTIFWGFLDIGASAGSNIGNSGTRSNTLHVVAVVFNGASSAIYVDNSATPHASGNAGTNGIGGILIGATLNMGSDLAQIKWADHAWSSQALGTTDLHHAFAYLATKYGTSWT